MSDLHNPYAAPRQEAAVGSPTSMEWLDADKGKRVLNLVIDYVAILTVSIVVDVAFAILTGSPPSQGVGFALLFGYYVFFEALLGWTPGKLITGTRVVARDGARASFKQILARSAVRFVPFEPFSFLGRSGSGWHDRWSATRVVLAASRST